MQRFIQKFSHPSFVKKEHSDYAIYLQKTYGPGFLQSFYQILSTVNVQFQAPRTQIFAFKYIYYALRLEHTG